MRTNSQDLQFEKLTFEGVATRAKSGNPKLEFANLINFVIRKIKSVQIFHAIWYNVHCFVRL